MRKIYLGLNLIIVIGILCFGIWQKTNYGANEMKVKFQEHYQNYKVIDLYNTRRFGSGGEFVIVYEHKEIKYRAWLNPDGTINEQETLKD